MLQRQARALGDPTRYEIFRRIADSQRAFDVAELTESFGLNHNAIRQHLAKLVEAGLVIEHRAPGSRRGRPKLLYRLDPTAESRWGVIGPYEKLALLLTEVLRTGDAPAEVGRRAGRAQIEGLAETARSSNPIESLHSAMALQGFNPQVSTEDGTIEARLLECPFASAAALDPETVCELHVGMVEGIVESITGIEMDRFDRADPLSGRCCMRCHVVHPGASMDREGSLPE